MNNKVTLIIPVRRDVDKLERCLQAVQAGTVVPRIIVMDCTADPEVLRRTRERFGTVRFFNLGMNPGRAHAVNTGFHITQTPYVMTLSPRLLVGKHCVEKLCAALDEDGGLFSAQAKILTQGSPSRIAGAGWLLDPGANPVVRGAGSGANKCARRAKITAAQMDAAIYRMEYLEVTGILDERFYTRLEDLDLGYRSIIAGFKNVCEPSAQCKEMAPEPGGAFYEQLEVGNMEYFRYKCGLNELPLSRELQLLRDLKLPEGLQFLSGLKLPGGLQLLRGLKPPSRSGEQDPQREAALERGRMLCLQAEIEQMERQELGMSVTALTLSDEFYMEIKGDGPRGVRPLYVGTKLEQSLMQIPDLLRAHLYMPAGAAWKLRCRLKCDS